MTNKQNGSRSSKHHKLQAAETELVQLMSDYLSMRGNFLAQVIRADLHTLPESFFVAPAPKNLLHSNNDVRSIEMVPLVPDLPTISPEATPVANGNGNKLLSAATAQVSVESMLVQGVMAQTGYPAESIQLEARLLDDLNLDSIKAGELVASVAKSCGVQGELDPSSLANATLTDIAAAIRALQQAAGVDVQQPTAVSARPTSAPGKSQIAEQLLDLIVTQTGFPKESLAMDLRLLDDLNLDSIKAAEVVAAMAKQLGVEGQLDPSTLANATLADVVEALSQLHSPMPLAVARPDPGIPPAQPVATPSWVRNFGVEYIEQALVVDRPEDWSQARVLLVVDRYDLPLVLELRQHLYHLGAFIQIVLAEELESALSGKYSHAIAILPRPEDCPTQMSIPAMAGRLHGLATLPTPHRPDSIAYIQFGGGQFGETHQPVSPATACAAAFARSLHLERPQLRVRAIDLAPDTNPVLATCWLLAELAGSATIVTAGYDHAGVRRVPQARLHQPTQYIPRNITWTNQDVILVTGGAKGITAECALAISQATGAKMALVGRSSATSLGADLAQTLARFQSQGLICRYYACDIASAEAVAELVHTVTGDLGVVTGVVHGAGLNTPRRVEQVTLAAAIAEVSPKLLGADNLLATLDADRLKMFLAFSSAIGVTGMPGNTWYAFANESLNLLLNQYHAAHPNTATISLAYSVWGEVGMGARMGSIKTLAKMGIDAIPTEEGVQRCVRLFTHDPGTSQVVIAARMAGLDTWKSAAPPPANDLRFIEDVRSLQPGVEVVVRSHLTLERDLYVQDHIWRGSYLFPTVFGLEAMAQAVAHATANPHPPIIRIENISLRRPVVVSPETGVTIELHAEIGEADAMGEQRVTVGIRTEQTGFNTDHFKAEFILGTRQPQANMQVDLPDALALNPKVDLYNQGGLLFQGPLFQQLEQVHALSRERSLLKAHAYTPAELQDTGFAPSTGNRFVLGDPYFRDVLLQCMQVNIPQDICLPVQIDRLDVCIDPTENGGDRSIQAILNFKEGREYHCEVVATDANGLVVEHLQGYRLRILEEHLENPTAAELAAPAQRDRDILTNRLGQVFQQLHLSGTTVELAYAPNLGALSRTERRQQEAPVVAKALREQLAISPAESTPDFEIDSNAAGKPFFRGDIGSKLDLSLSHDDCYCLCSLGETIQGCDIESIESRSTEDWRALIGNERFRLVEELVAKGDTLDRAAMRIWSAVEAARKAVAGVEPNLSIVQWQGDAILLAIQVDEITYHIVTFPILLTRKPERMIALVAIQSPRIDRSSPLDQSSQAYIDLMTGHNDNSVMITSDGPQAQLVYNSRFPVSFQEACSISRNVNLSRFIGWVGESREHPLRSIGHQLLADFMQNQTGMVTNNVAIRLLGEATTYDIIQSRVWLDSYVNSTFLTYIEFCKVLADDSLERVAVAEVKATWVQLKSYGVPIPVPFPDYLQEFADLMAPSSSTAINLKSAPTEQLPDRAESLSHLDPGALVYQVPPEVNHYGDLLLVDSFQTTLEESNVVGNVYYGNYFTWQGRMLDLFLYQTAPEYLRVSSARGEIIPLFSHMTFLKEAMPFDKIRVKLYVKSVKTCGADLVFEYFRENPNGNIEKLHTGEQSVIWVLRDRDGQPQAASWPTAVLAKFLANAPKSDLPAHPLGISRS